MRLVVLSHSKLKLSQAVRAFAECRTRGYTEMTPVLMALESAESYRVRGLPRPASPLPPVLPAYPPLDGTLLSGYPVVTQRRSSADGEPRQRAERIPALSALRHADVVCYLEKPKGKSVTFGKTLHGVYALDRTRAVNSHATLHFPSSDAWFGNGSGSLRAQPELTRLRRWIEVDRYLDYNSRNVIRHLSDMGDAAPTMSSLQALSSISGMIDGRLVLSDAFDMISRRPFGQHGIEAGPKMSAFSRAVRLAQTMDNPAWTEFLEWLLETGLGQARTAGPLMLLTTPECEAFANTIAPGNRDRDYFNRLPAWRRQGLDTARAEIDEYLTAFAERQASFGPIGNPPAERFAA